MSYSLKPIDIQNFANAILAITKPKGKELQFEYCPYCGGGDHKDTYTFSIDTESGAFNCLRSSCGHHGHFVELARDFNFELDYGLTQKQYKPLPQKKPETTNSAIEYLKSRGISEATAKRYLITTSRNNKNILVFPFYDENNILVAAKYRKTDFDKTKDKNKEWFEKDTKPILFGMAQCKNFDRLIITEGQIDSLTVSDCGFDNAVSVPTGAKGFTWLPLCWDWIIKFKEVIVFGDYEKGRMSLIDELSSRLPQVVKQVRFADYLGEKDANDIYRKYGKSAIEACICNAERVEIKAVKDLSTVENVDLNALPKIKSNIKELDRIIGGFYYGQVILLSGKRGEGKSTFASQLCCEALEQNENIFVYSGELADYHFKRWIDYQLAGKENLIEQTNEYNEPVYSIPEETNDKISAWYKGRAFIYDNSYIPDKEGEYEGLIKTIEKVIMRLGVRFILIDNLMTAMDTVSEQNNLYLAQSNFVGNLKKTAVKYNVVILLIAHPRKNDGELDNDDISGSSDITNKVDVVMMYSRAKPDDECNSKLMVTKNRLTGKLAKEKNAIELYFSEATKTISSISTPLHRKYSWDKSCEWDDIEEIF